MIYVATLCHHLPVPRDINLIQNLVVHFTGYLSCRYLVDLFSSCINIDNL